MTKLTLTQRVLRPVLNFLVERYFPYGAFYGSNFFDAFKEYQEAGDGLAQLSTLWLTHNMVQVNATEMHLSIKGLTINGDPCGDFFITATRTPEPPVNELAGDNEVKGGKDE